jgi:hypothetical protein
MVSKNKRKRNKNNKAKRTGEGDAPPPAPTASLSAPPEEATSLPLPASFTEGEPQPAPVVVEDEDQPLSHIAEAMVEELLATVTNEEEAPAKDIQQMAENKIEDVFTPEEFVGDLIGMKFSQKNEETEQETVKEEEEEAPVETPASIVGQTRSTASRSLPDPVFTEDLPVPVATTPIAMSQPRTSPVSTLQELDDSSKEAAQATAANASPSNSSKASVPEEDTPVDKSALAAPYDEVSPSSPEKTKVTFTLPEKDTKTSEGDDEPDLVSNMYNGVKGAWMWSKSHVPLANLWMGLTESVANSVLEVATGNNLHAMDEKIIQPHITGFDSKILNPAIHALVDAILRDEGKDPNPLQSILLSILRPPVRFLVHDDGTKMTGETSVEG